MPLRFVVCLLALSWTIAAPHVTRAHEVRPAIVTASFDRPLEVAIEVTANLEALIAGIGPEHKDTDHAPTASQYNALRTLAPAELKARFEAFAPRWLDLIRVEMDGQRLAPLIAEIEVPPVGDTGQSRISTVRMTAARPAAATAIRWSYPAAFGASVLRVKQMGSSELATAWLKAGTPSEPVPIAGAPPKSTLGLLAEYVYQGFIHIVPEGLDHILFVLGLFFLSTQVRPLLVQVTSFTVAHSITLALGLYGIVQVSPAIVEPLIALSIVYVAVENILTQKLTPWRPFVVFAFGLLHGLGFAGLLQEIGLQRADFLTGLIGFNIGVELGQLAVIGMAFLATAMWFGREPWYRARIAIPASLAIALTGLFWTVQRVWLA